MNSEEDLASWIEAGDVNLHTYILDAIHEAVCVVDKDFRIVYHNRVFSDLASEDEPQITLVGRHLSEISFILEETFDNCQLVINGDKVASQEYSVKGMTFELELVPWKSGETIDGIIIVLHENTKSAIEPEATSTSFRYLYENLSDAIFQTDMHGFITLTGAKGTSLFGYETDELLGMHFTELLAHSERDRVANLFRQRLSSLEDNPNGMEAIGLRKDGSEFVFHTTNTILYDEDNRPVGYQSLVRDVTEMKQKERDALEREYKYRALFEQNNDAVLILSLDRDILESNQRAKEMFGFSQGGLEGSPFAQLLWSDESRKVEMHLKQIQSGKDLPPCEHEFLKMNQERFYGEVKLSLLREQNGTPLYFQAIIRNVTARKENERALKKEHERSQMYLDLVGVMVVALDVNGDIMLLNQKVCQILGYPEKDLIGKNWFELAVPNGGYQAAWDEYRQLMLGSRELPAERINNIRTRTGEIRTISWSNTLLRNEDGKIIGALSSGEDITENERILDALRLEKRRYQVLFETAPVAIGVTTETGDILDTNLSFQELLGFSADELEWMSAYDIYTTSTERNRVTEELHSNGFVRDLLVHFKRKDGALLDVLLNIDYVDYEDDVVRLTTVRDVTELNRTRRKLEEEQARAEFYADLLAHDLNNVHQGILIGAELLLMDIGLSDSSRLHAQAIREQVTRGLQLIENVRKLSIIDMDKEPNLVTIDLHGVLENAIMMTQHAFPLKQARVDVKFGSGQVLVKADEFLIDLFYNMIHNAMKYDPRDEVAIQIEVESGARPGFVNVAIVDEGPGIPYTRRDELFSRLEKGKTLGSGMGLTLVRYIAERYHGHAWIEDRVEGFHDRGSKFIVELPIVNASSQ